MKKSLFLTYIFLLLVAASSCQNSQNNSVENREPVTESSQPAATAVAATDLPNLPLTKLDGTQLQANNLSGKTILFFFQPDCDHCQRETVQIQENLSAFRDYTLYFITNYSQAELAKFAREYKLAFEPNVVFARATLEDILNTVGPMESPTMFIYSDKGRLVNTFKGETPIATILPALKN